MVAKTAKIAGLVEEIGPDGVDESGDALHPDLTLAQAAALAALRRPLPAHLIGKRPVDVPKDRPSADKRTCGVCRGYHVPSAHLDYAGHAAITERLLEVDPLWSWEPVTDPTMLAVLPRVDGGMWIRLTVAGVTRMGYGDAAGKSGHNAVKEIIGDALRNAAMRFGVGLHLWHKGDLHVDEEAAKREAEQDAQRQQTLDDAQALADKAGALPAGDRNALQTIHDTAEAANLLGVAVSALDKVGPLGGLIAHLITKAEPAEQAAPDLAGDPVE